MTVKRLLLRGSRATSPRGHAWKYSPPRCCGSRIDAGHHVMHSKEAIIESSAAISCVGIYPKPKFYLAVFSIGDSWVYSLLEQSTRCIVTFFYLHELQQYH